jgi:hypothetical protein
MRCVHGLLLALACVVVSHSVWAACGSRGGPAFRAPNGKCVGWADLPKVCGTPPTTNCTYEGGGIGDTGQVDQKPGGSGAYQGSLGFWPGQGSSTPASNFNVRTVKSDGIACTSQTATAGVTTACAANGKDCSDHVKSVIEAGTCVRVPAGAKAVIEAGSHSFDWVRFRVEGDPRPLWSARGLLLN